MNSNKCVVILRCNLCGAPWTDDHRETCCYVTNEPPRASGLRGGA